jgi:hypothetical protein
MIDSADKEKDLLRIHYLIDNFETGDEQHLKDLTREIWDHAFKIGFKKGLKFGLGEMNSCEI